MSGATSVTGRIYIRGTTAREVGEARQHFLDRLGDLGLDRYVQATAETGDGHPCARFRLREESAGEWAPDSDTIQLCRKLNLDTQGDSDDLEREILLDMLLGSVAFEFPGHHELASAVRIRKNIVAAARETALAFHTTQAERLADYWTYAKGRGFTLQPGKSLC